MVEAAHVREAKEQAMPRVISDIQERLATIVLTYFIVKQEYNRKDKRFPGISDESEKNGCTFCITEIETMVKRQDTKTLSEALTATGTTDSITTFRERRDKTGKKGLMDYLQNPGTRKGLYSHVMKEYGRYIAKVERGLPLITGAA